MVYWRISFGSKKRVHAGARRTCHRDSWAAKRYLKLFGCHDKVIWKTREDEQKVNMPDELYDINPRFWLSRYKKTSVSYLIKMGIFYLVLGLGLQQVGNGLALHFISNYQVPSVPISLALGLSSGPLEEIM